MRIPDDVLDCVAFICVEVAKPDRTEYQIGGTGFFVTVGGEQRPNVQFTYLVTARHCVQPVINRGAKLFLRLNRATSTVAYVELPLSGWLFNEETYADVAILPFSISRADFHIKWIGTDTFASREFLVSHNIGIGDELFMAGLFTQRAGMQRNMPIVRTGVIASMPTEQILDQNTGLTFNAYVAEVRSIGGLSGSPVFAFLSTTNRPASSQQLNDVGWRIVLIGVIRGHWEVKPKAADDLEFTLEDTITMNTGLALVYAHRRSKRHFDERRSSQQTQSSGKRVFEDTRASTGFSKQ